jgi:antirestriction protein
MSVSTETVPSIYVACLASYNNGVLHGVHIDLEEGIEESDVWDRIKAMLAESKEPDAEEWAIHDFEGFHPIRLGESEWIGRVLVWAEGIREGGDAYKHWVVDVLGRDYGQDPSVYSLDNFRDAFIGEYDSLAAYGQEDFESAHSMDDVEKAVGNIIHFVDWEEYGEHITEDCTVVQNGATILIYDLTRG